ncbi:MAG: hypothetical protein CMF99_01620 [Candidatus Marinimicrobia bacterium]|nr:hypothetical protein [Candidatus Neomarinimicrobiota bacterium]
MMLNNLSSIGFGLYKGDHSDLGDEKWVESLNFGLQSGINVIDTAQNYRNGRSDIIIGNVIKTLESQGSFNRKDVFISSKAGLLSENIIKSDSFIKLGLNQNQIDYKQKFCMEPKFIDWSVERALKVMKLNYLDAFLLHNPELAYLRNNGNEKILSCLEILEKKSQEGKINYYGFASWNGFRRRPESALYLDIVSILDELKDRIGLNNKFKIIEAPLSIGMPNIIYYHSKDKKKDTLQVILKKYGLKFFSSASLYEGFLNELFELNKLYSLTFKLDSNNEHTPAKVSFPKSENSLIQLFELLLNLKKNNIELEATLREFSSDEYNLFNVALDIVRSTDFVDCALTGMENIKYAKKNVKLLNCPKLDAKIVKNYWNKFWMI